MTTYKWSRPFTITHQIDAVEHPIFKVGEKLHCNMTQCGTYRIIRQDTSKVFHLYRGYVLQRTGSSAKELKTSI